jgi:uncharacterized protein YceH (UPF0502 family)
MQPLESQEVVQGALQRLMERPEPMVQRIPTPRADRFAQLLCPGLHAIEAVQPEGGAPAPGAEAIAAAGEPGAPGRLALLEDQVRELRQIVERLAAALGATDILKPPGDGPQQEPPATRQ